MGPGLAEPADGQVDDVRMAFAHLRVADAETLRHTGTEALDDHVALLRDAQRRFRTGRPLQVQRETALAAVGHVVDGRVAAVARADGAAPVAVGRLELDHVGAVLRQQHPAVRTGQALAQVEHAQSGKREVIVRGAGDSG